MSLIPDRRSAQRPPEGIACWFIDTDYNEESFFVRHAYFLGQNDPYGAQDYPKGGDQRRRLENAQQRHLPAIRQAQVRTYCDKGNKSPRG